VAYADLLGQRTWYQPAKGRGKSVVLLHGGLSNTNSMWHSIGPGLRQNFSVSGFDRRGHGRTGDTDAPFSYEAMADETIAFLEFLGRRSHLVGHSDGGNVALAVARRRPDLVRRVVAIGANYHHSGLMAMEPFTPESASFAEFAEGYGALAPEGPAHAAVVVQKSRRLVESEPRWTTRHLAAIERPVLVVAGDDDVTTFRHLTTMYEALRDAELAVVPGTSHGVLKERTKLATLLIVEYLKSSLPPRTRSPIRRGEVAP